MNLFIAILKFFPLLIYHIFQSFILAFIPRRFQHKKDLKGQKILITGAGSGVGRQLAIEFSKHAVCLVLLDINKESLRDTEKLLDRRSTVFFYDCDVSDRRKVYEVADKIKKDVGDMDIVVNNAGIVSGNYLMDIPDEKIVKTLEVNALAHFWVVKSFLPAMMTKNRGHIVSIASIAGKHVIPKTTDYCASKFAAVGFAESLEIELREKKLDGIKVTIVCPAHIDTGLFEGAKPTVGSIMSPEYVAREVVMAVQKEKEIIYTPRFFSLLVMACAFLPRHLIIKFHEITGNMKVMENFTGRTAVNYALKKEE